MKTKAQHSIAAGVLGATLAATGQAQNTTVDFDIPPQAASSALITFGEQAGVSVLVNHAVREVQLPGLKGAYNVEEAIDLLLQGAALEYRYDNEGIIVSPAKDKQAKAAVKSRNNAKIKRKRGTLFSAVAGALAAAFTSGAVAAQEEVAGKQKTKSRMEEIVVTAQKREQSLREVPMSVFAQTGEVLNARGVTDLQSLSLAVPGLLVSESGSFQRRISIRGIGNTFGSSSLVGLYLDETSVTSLPSNQIDLRVHDLKRVEVLKGPQGTLYGEGSVGGTIRYITNDPKLNSYNGSVTIEGSSTKDGDPSKEVKGVVNIPFIKDKLGLRIVGEYIDSGGWIDQPALNKSNINDYQLYNVRSKLLWRPSDNLELKGTVVIHRNDAGAQNTAEDGNGNYHQLFDDPSTPSGEDNYELYNLTAKYNFKDITLVSTSSLLESDKRANNWGNQCCFPTDTPGELWNQFQPVFKTSAEILTQEFRASADSDAAWNWTVGLFYKDATLHPLTIPEEGLVGVPGGTLGIDLFTYILWQEELSQSWAIFGETSYALNDKLEIGAGLRYFNDEREFRDDRNGPYQKEKFDSKNPKVFVSYAPTENINIYASAAKGFRSGGFNGAEQPAYKPESVWSYELGTKVSLMGGRFNGELSLFHSDYEDYQVIGVIPGYIGNITSNAGNAEINGIDVSLQLYATEHIEVGFSGNYMDTEFTEINAGSSSHAVGDPLDLVPEYGYSLWVDYAFSWFDSSPGFLRFDYSQQGKSHFRNRSFGSDYHSSSDTIGKLNARLGWEHNRLSAELYALNILNERGFIGPIVIELGAARPRPRTVGINLSYTF